MKNVFSPIDDSEVEQSDLIFKNATEVNQFLNLFKNQIENVPQAFWYGKILFGLYFFYK